MTTSKLPPSGGRRPPTIDLTATEIEGTSQHQGEPSAGPNAAQSAAEPSPRMEAEAPRMDTSAGESPTNESAAAESAAESPRRVSPVWLPARIPWPLIGAGAAGGAVVLVLLGIASLFTSGDTGVSAFDARLARLEQQVRDVAARPLPAGADAGALDGVRGRLAKLETAIATPRSGTADPALASRIATIEGEVKALAETIGVLGRRSDEIATSARDARQRADATAAALAELTQKVARPGAPAVERSELEALANRMAAVERGEKAVEAELAKRPGAESGDRGVRLALAAAVLEAAVERGDPFAAEVATVKALAADAKAISPLDVFASSGVPTAAALSHELAELAPALLLAAGAGSTSSRDTGFLGRLQASADKLVRIRPIDAVAGSDPAAIIARIEVKASHADLAGALAELATLAPNVRAPAEAWIKKAQMRIAAVDTSRRLAADAMSGLSK
jgi:hypothetical protein